MVVSETLAHADSHHFNAVSRSICMHRRHLHPSTERRHHRLGQLFSLDTINYSLAHGLNLCCGIRWKFLDANIDLSRRGTRRCRQAEGYNISNGAQQDILSIAARHFFFKLYQTVLLGSVKLICPCKLHPPSWIFFLFSYPGQQYVHHTK